MSKYLLAIILLALAFWGLSSCVIPTEETTQEAPGAIYTQAMATLLAQQTLQAGQSAVETLTQMAVPSQANATPTPFSSLAATDLPPQESTATPFPTWTPLPPATATAIATATPMPPTRAPVLCDWASLVKDITVAAGQSFNPGEAFTKTWRLQNIGSCTWDRNYALVFDNGSLMDGASVVWLENSVRPGDSVDLSVRLKAPAQEGQYTGYWRLRNSAGVLFGIGASANAPFSVAISVNARDQIAFSFTEDYCRADWTSKAGDLPCPGSDNDLDLANGVIVRYNSPVLESGRVENEPALVVHPDMGNFGNISGEYGRFQVAFGDHFHAYIGCMYQNPECNVVFQLNYRVSGGSMQGLMAWPERYDGNITLVDVDLSFLAGKSVEFELTVLANGYATGDWAFWLNPVILR